MAEYDRFPLQGGLDTATPYLSRTPGSLTASVNFSPETDGGYQLDAGYERFDGRPAPSEAIIYSLTMTTPVTGVLPGTQVTGSISGSVAIVGTTEGNELWVDVINGVNFTEGDVVAGYTVQFISTEAIDQRSYDPTAQRTNILLLDPVTSNTLAIGDTLLGLSSSAIVRVDDIKFTNAEMWTYVTFLAGGPQDGETLLKGDTTTYELIKQYDVEPMLSSPDTPAGVFFYLSELRRSKIGQVPGINSVRGVWDLEGKVYAFRDIDGSAGGMYVSSATGWTLVQLGFTMGWNLRPSTIFDDDLSPGDVLVGVTSGATATVGWVGYLAQDHATGYVTFKTITGTFVAGEDLKNTSNADKIIGKVTAAPTANTLSPGGLYRFVNHNFTGGLNTFAMYGVNGIDKGMVYNETYGFSFIPTQADIDTPFDVVEYKDHLFYAFPRGSLQHSVLGSPMDWSGGLGALAVGVGSEISSLIPAPKALIICTEKDIQSLEGGSIDDWQKEVITQHTGISKFTGLYQSQSFVLAQAGIIAVDRTDQFGNFSDGTISDIIRGVLVPNFSRCTGAMARKSRGQYRLFFEGDLNVSLSTNQGNITGFSLFDYGGLTVRAAVNPYGRIFFISDTGYVYHDSAGASNDGAERSYVMRTSFANQGDPDTRKRYRRMDMSIRSESYVNARVNFTYNKGSGTPQSAIESGLIVSGGGRWDLSLWGQVYWDATESPTISSDIDGIGFDISTMIFIRSRIHPPFTAEDMSIEWSPRRKVR